MSSAIVSNSFYIQGRIDGSQSIPFTLQFSNTDDSNYVYYCKGYGSSRASIDYEKNIISNLECWPSEAQEEYNTQYRILEFICPK